MASFTKRNLTDRQKKVALEQRINMTGEQIFQTNSQLLQAQKVRDQVVQKADKIYQDVVSRVFATPKYKVKFDDLKRELREVCDRLSVERSKKIAAQNASEEIPEFARKVFKALRTGTAGYPAFQLVWVISDRFICYRIPGHSSSACRSTIYIGTAYHVVDGLAILRYAEKFPNSEIPRYNGNGIVMLRLESIVGRQSKKELEALRLKYSEYDD